MTGAVVAILVDQGWGIGAVLFSQIVTPLTAFAMFLPYFLPKLETTAWAVLILVVNGLSMDALVNPCYLLTQTIAIKRGAQSIDQVRTFGSMSFIIVMSSGRILGASVFGGFLNEHFGFYFTSLIYSVFAVITSTWHVIFLARNGLLGKLYYPTALSN